MANTPPQGTPLAKKAVPEKPATAPTAEELKWAIEQNKQMLSEMAAAQAETQKAIVSVVQLEAERVKQIAIHRENEKQREHEADEAYQQRQHEEKQRAHEERQHEYEERKQIRDQEERRRERKHAEILKTMDNAEAKERRFHSARMVTFVIGAVGVFGVAGVLAVTGHLREAAELIGVFVIALSSYTIGRRESLIDAAELRNLLAPASAKPELPSLDKKGSNVG